MKKEWKYEKKVTLGLDSTTGKVKRKLIHADTKTGLECAEIEAKLEWNKSHSKKDMTWLNFSRQWLKNCCEGRVSTKCLKNYTDCLNNHLSPLDNIVMRNLTSSQIQKCINDCWNMIRTCREIKTVVRLIIKHAYSDGLIDRDLYSDLKFPTKKAVTVPLNNKKRPLTEDELKVLPTLNLTPLAKKLVFLLATFGLRPQEACALTPDKVDFTDGEIIIDTAMEYIGKGMNQPNPKGTKNGKVRHIPIPKHAINELQSMCDELVDCECKYFIQYKGQPIHLSMLQKRTVEIRKAFTEALGYKQEDGFSLYTFRHNFATRVLYYGAYKNRYLSLKGCAYLMGHTEEMFLKTYSHLIKEEENSVEALDAFSVKF